MDIEGESSNANSAPQAKLIKASLRSHTPDEIYDYVLKHVGELGMKIKKRQAIIGFENPELFERLLNEHKMIMLHGKKLEFVALSKADENFIVSEDEDQVVEMPKEKVTIQSPATMFPEFTTNVPIEDKINKCRLMMLEKVQELFLSSIENTRQKVNELKLQFKDAGPRKREMFALESALQKRLKQAESKYEAEIEKINNFVREFSPKPNNYELQPTFKFDDLISFPKIPLNNMKFDPVGFFSNLDRYPCKRLCALNGNQFAVTCQSPKKLFGYLKLYDVNISDPKQCMQMENGSYGVCRFNNYLLVGSYDSKIKYINMQDKQRQIQSSSTLCNLENCTFYQMKISNPSVQKADLITLSTIDLTLKKFQLSFEQIYTQVYSANFQLNWQTPVQASCVTFQMISPEIIMYGHAHRVCKHHIEKKKTKEISINGMPIKIKRFNQNIMAVATQKSIQMIDLRSDIVVQAFEYVPKGMRCIEVLGENSIMYGGDGVIGLVDDRKHEVLPWKSEVHHKDSTVYDILKLDNTVVSCDSAGRILSWKLSDGELRTAMIPEHVDELSA